METVHAEVEARAIPAGRGIDVSQYQGTIDWAKVKAEGVVWAFIRSGQGGTYIDPAFERNWYGAKEQGILVAPYHVVLPNQSEEAHWELLTALMKPKAADLPWAWDVEVGGGTSASRSTLVWNLCKRTAGILEGRYPLVYTAAWFWNPNMEKRDWKSVSDLWIASYTASAPAPLYGWAAWHFWQYTSSARLSGITANTVDVNAWKGTPAELQEYRLPVGELPPDTDPNPPVDGRKWHIEVVNGEPVFVAVE